LLASDETKVYFDIDLDFFTLNNPYNGKGKKFTYMKKEEMKNILSINNPLTGWIFERLSGFTMATEPKHCGGLFKSNKLLDIVNRIYFKPSIFSENCDWKHKSEK